MKPEEQSRFDSDTPIRSLAGWWCRLTDNAWQLFRYNLCLLPFILPVFFYLVIFFIFHAWLSLIAALIFLLPTGPALLALSEVTTKIANGEPRADLPRFFIVYRKYCGIGFLFSVALFVVGFLTLYPVYFAFFTASPARFWIAACATTAALLFCSVLPYASILLISGERHGLVRRSILLALKNGKVSLLAGLLQIVALLFCLLSPYVAVFAILLGMPSVVSMVVAYILPNANSMQQEE